MDKAKGFFNSSEGTNYIVELDFSPDRPTDCADLNGFSLVFLEPT